MLAHEPISGKFQNQDALNLRLRKLIKHFKNWTSYKCFVEKPNLSITLKR